jgi:hypothetical protein
MTLLDDTYWGGWMDGGEVLHLVVVDDECLRSACGRYLNIAYDLHDQMRGACCKTCLRIEKKWEREEMEAAGVS